MSWSTVQFLSPQEGGSGTHRNCASDLKTRVYTLGLKKFSIRALSRKSVDECRPKSLRTVSPPPVRDAADISIQRPRHPARGYYEATSALQGCGENNIWAAWKECGGNNGAALGRNCTYVHTVERMCTYVCWVNVGGAISVEVHCGIIGAALG